MAKYHAGDEVIQKEQEEEELRQVEKQKARKLAIEHELTLMKDELRKNQIEELERSKTNRQCTGRNSNSKRKRVQPGECHRKRNATKFKLGRALNKNGKVTIL